MKTAKEQKWKNIIGYQ